MAKKLGLYLHIPFCESKCAYCDFYSVAGKDAQGAVYRGADSAFERIRRDGEDVSRGHGLHRRGDPLLLGAGGAEKAARGN